MKSQFVVLAVVVLVLAAAVLLVLWLQKPDPLSGAGVEALAERQAASAPPRLPRPLLLSSRCPHRACSASIAPS